MAGPEGLHACSISILVTIWYPHHVDMLSTTRSKLWSKYFPNLGEARMMNVMLRPPTESRSNLCDKCDGVWSQDDNLEHPSSWMSYPRVFSVGNGIIEGWGHSRVWPPTSIEVSSPCHHLGLEALDLDRWLICEWWWWCDCDVVWRTSVTM